MTSQRSREQSDLYGERQERRVIREDPLDSDRVTERSIRKKSKRDSPGPSSESTHIASDDERGEINSAAQSEGASSSRGVKRRRNSGMDSVELPEGKEIVISEAGEGELEFPAEPSASQILPTSTPNTGKPLPTLLARPKKSASSPGIVYISRLPPGMTPQKVKHLMGQWGEIGKVYAQRREQSDLSSTKSSSSTASNKPKHQKHQQANYSEAWVEFLDKKYAKVAADVLNAKPIGGKKGDKWRDDIWTMRYLSGFKWEMLGEQVAHERQAHSSRLRQELSKSRLEQSEYLRNVELARVLEKRKARKVEAGVDGRAGGDGSRPAAEGKSGSLGGDKGQRGYRQRELAGADASKRGTGQSDRKAGKSSVGGGRNGSGPVGGDAMAGVLAGLF